MTNTNFINRLTLCWSDKLLIFTIRNSVAISIPSYTMCVAAHNGFKRITGIDLSKKLCDAAKQNCNTTQEKIPEVEFDIINNDAFYYDIPEDVDCIFMFNPFDEIIMSGVANNIHESLREHPREMKIIYVNPLHKSLFTNTGFKEVYYSKKMKYLEVAILEKS